MKKTREQWLMEAVKALKPDFKAQGASIPKKVRVSCGLPSKRAFSNRNRTIGQCWSTECSADKATEIFISPVLDKPVDVLATLVHELVHACVGTEAGHKAPFKRLAVALGLEGKMTATEAGSELRAHLNTLAKKLGKYPHAAMDYTKRKKQGTRMKKLECPACGYVVRTTAKWIEYGIPTCPCGVEMEQSS